jgi:tetratricopeptide (TPR) repeat protein
MKRKKMNRDRATFGELLGVWTVCILLGVSIVAVDTVLIAGGGPNVTGAKLYIQQNQMDDAVEVLQKEIKTVDDENEDAWYLLGYIYGRRKQYDLMIEAFDKALELKPKFAEKGIKVSKDSGTKFHSAHGVDKIKKVIWAGEFNAAVNAFNGAIGATDEAQEKEQYGLAIGHFEAAMQIMPDSTGAHRNLAAAYINMGDYDSSIPPLQAAIESNPGDKDVKIMLAKVYASTNRDSLAIPVLTELWESGHQDEEMADYLSRSYLNLGEKEKAMEIYRSALAANPDNMSFRYNYGIILLEAKDYSAAIEQLLKVYEKDPDFGDVSYNLGAAYLNRGVDQREALPDERFSKISKLLFRIWKIRSSRILTT